MPVQQYRPQHRIQIEREEASDIYAHIKSEIDNKKYRLFLLKCAHRENEVITVKRNSYHEAILKRVFNLL